jgi:hypothetical protein
MELERWGNFDKRQQLLIMAAEFARAKNWQRQDQEKFLLALERALELIDLSFQDPKWKGDFYMLLKLRDEVAKFYSLKHTDDISILCDVL